jgi:iron complex outermembrane recepter protein
MGCFQKGEIMKLTRTAILMMATCLTVPAFAQDPDIKATDASTLTEEDGAIIVTGSSIKRKPQESAVPLQIYTNEDITR